MDGNVDRLKVAGISRAFQIFVKQVWKQGKCTQMHSSQTINLSVFYTKPVLFLFGLENEKLEVWPLLDLEEEHVYPKRMLLMVSPHWQ